MASVLGYLDSNGRPRVDLLLRPAGDQGPFTPCSVLLDTGCDLFMLLSREQARTIGLVEEGSLYVTVADDRLVECQSALIEIEVGGKTRTGTVALSTGAGDILVGMDFLRTFKLGLYISKDTVLLYDEDEAAAS